MTDRRDIAIELADKHGFAVFTLAYKTKVPHKGSHGFKDATRDRVKIEAMFAEHPDSNIAVAGGAVSGNIGIIASIWTRTAPTTGARSFRIGRPSMADSPRQPAW